MQAEREEPFHFIDRVRGSASSPAGSGRRCSRFHLCRLYMQNNKYFCPHCLNLSVQSVRSPSLFSSIARPSASHMRHVSGLKIKDAADGRNENREGN